MLDQVPALRGKPSTNVLRSASGEHVGTVSTATYCTLELVKLQAACICQNSSGGISYTDLAQESGVPKGSSLSSDKTEHVRSESA